MQTPPNGLERVVREVGTLLVRPRTRRFKMGSSFNVEVLKEPRGFIKCLEIVSS